MERFELGGVYLAGRAALPDSPVVAPCRLEYYEPRFELSDASSFYPQFSPDWIIDVDDDVGVVCKPAGLPTTAARDQSRYSLSRYLEEHFGSAVHMPSRLDTGVAGVLLFSRSSRMNRTLQRAYDSRRVRKVYLALLGNTVEWSNRDIQLPLGRDSRHPVLRCVDTERGESAHTRVHALYTDSGRTLVQAEPLTGRTHQIRVHCAAEGAPIVGDPYYGGAQDAALHLISFALRFFHPYRREDRLYVLPIDRRPQWLRVLEQRHGDSSRLLKNSEL